jgi:cob(I)alamin adenosyltransferase
MKIYTGLGDDGNTHLLGGQQVRKNDVRISVCGTLDELNAVFGLVASGAVPEPLFSQLVQVQNDLFRLGCMIASVGATSKMDLPSLDAADARRLEAWIDSIDAQLEPLSNFLLPGGAREAAAMHLARAVCRRSERQVADLVEQHPDFEADDVLRFLNRLGDWCFVAARYINRQRGVKEPLWKSRQ